MLLVLAHGSPDPRHAAAVTALTSRIPGAAAGYLGHGPDLAAAVEALGGPVGGQAAIVVPLLLSRAFHARVDVPAAVRRLGRAWPLLRVRTASAIGPDPALLAGLATQLVRHGVRPGPGVGVVLAWAGSRDPRAGLEFAALTERWRQRWLRCAPGRGTTLGGPAHVAAAALSGPGPGVPEAVASLWAAGCREVALAAWLLTPGVLLDRAVAQARAAGVGVITPGLWQTEELAAVVRARASAASASAAG